LVLANATHARKVPKPMQHAQAASTVHLVSSLMALVAANHARWVLSLSLLEAPSADDAHVAQKQIATKPCVWSVLLDSSPLTRDNANSAQAMKLPHFQASAVVFLVALASKPTPTTRPVSLVHLVHSQETMECVSCAKKVLSPPSLERWNACLVSVARKPVPMRRSVCRVRMASSPRMAARVNPAPSIATVPTLARVNAYLVWPEQKSTTSSPLVNTVSPDSSLLTVASVNAAPSLNSQPTPAPPNVMCVIVVAK